jgi:hypothetical protein
MSNVIDRLDSPPLPEGYQPKWIDFYYFDEFAKVCVVKFQATGF